ncbi:MAG: DUF4167 domain-containing protein [Allosphingosinicella sp.]
MRGRNRNPKGPNPLTRSYESNGPDVKIRGTAQHIADKYAQLARDAQASGDPVAAENYHQHAEHYYRIIAAAQEQFREQFGGAYQQRPFDDDGDDDGPGSGGDRPMQAGDEDIAGQPQPYELRPEQGERQDRFDRGDRQDRGDRFQGRDRFDRGDRPQGQHRFPRNDRPRQDLQRPDHRPDGNRQDGGRDGNRQDQRPDDRQGGRPRPDYRQDQPRFERPARPRDEVADQGPNGLPAFLTTPVRAPISVDEPEADDAAPIEAVNGEGPGEPNGRFKARRRRRPRAGEGGEPSPDFGPDGDIPRAE